MSPDRLSAAIADIVGGTARSERIPIATITSDRSCVG